MLMVGSVVGHRERSTFIRRCTVSVLGGGTAAFGLVGNVGADAMMYKANDKRLVPLFPIFQILEGRLFWLFGKYILFAANPGFAAVVKAASDQAVGKSVMASRHCARNPGQKSADRP